MAWFSPEDCGCCSDVENICEKLVDAISLDSAEPCLAAFIGSWATFLGACAGSACSFDCKWCSASFNPSVHPDAECDVSGTIYVADQIYIEVIGFTASDDVWVRIGCFWDDEFGSPLAQLRGSFYSSDGGLTFGPFQKDVFSPTCSGLTGSVAPPTDGDDLTCILTII